jgi:hypothetical protein
MNADKGSLSGKSPFVIRRALGKSPKAEPEEGTAINERWERSASGEIRKVSPTSLSPSLLAGEHWPVCIPGPEAHSRHLRVLPSGNAELLVLIGEGRRARRHPSLFTQKHPFRRCG